MLFARPSSTRWRIANHQIRIRLGTALGALDGCALWLWLFGLWRAESLLAIGHVAATSAATSNVIEHLHPPWPACRLVNSTPASARLSASVLVPINYINGSQLSGSMTFAGTTFAGLGVLQGTYVYNLPNGLDDITLNIPTVPEPSTLGLIGLGLLGLGAMKRRQYS